jgi:acyl-[acyl carrier protein]--UDP-N-acetylglucosamine O-acyltransferase
MYQKKYKMNTTEVMIVLNNGVRKYGTILNDYFTESLQVSVGTDLILNTKIQLTNRVEYIPLNAIRTIDQFLK